MLCSVYSPDNSIYLVNDFRPCLTLNAQFCLEESEENLLNTFEIHSKHLQYKYCSELLVPQKGNVGRHLPRSVLFTEGFFFALP